MMFGMACRRPGHRDRQAGFTLIEVLVSMAVLSLILVALYGGLRVAARGWDRGEALVRDAEMLRTSSALLRRYLGQAYPLLRWKKGTWRLEFAGDEAQLRFVAAMPPRLGVGGLYELHISTEERANGVALLLHRRLLHPDLDDRAQDDLAAGIADDSVLAEGLREVGFDYFGSERRNDPPAWRERWLDKKRLPALVRMRVVDGRGVAWPELTVALHIDAVRRLRTLAPSSAPAGPVPAGSVPIGNSGAKTPGAVPPAASGTVPPPVPPPVPGAMQ